MLEGVDATQQITVRATYSDGTDRDVTNLALFMSNNDPVAKIDKEGKVRSGERGAAFMLARFDVFSVTAQVHRHPEGSRLRAPGRRRVQLHRQAPSTSACTSCASCRPASARTRNSCAA